MNLKVFDFFSGCGGSTKGFHKAGLIPSFALDIDEDAANTFMANFPEVAFVIKDIMQFDSNQLEKLLSEADRTLFCGCAPCQPFTGQNTTKPDSESDPRRTLLSRFGELVADHQPDYVFVENVPGIQRVSGNCLLTRFDNNLKEQGYHTKFGVVESRKYGVPQRRRRLVFLASRKAAIEFPDPTHDPALGRPYSTVRDWISHLPPIVAGETHSTIPNHRAANLSPLNLQRIRATPPEGCRADWPQELHLACHSKNGYRGHSDVYGRMKWDGPATGLTTRCISLSNGRYGHPDQHRAISVREAAGLQTFPDDYEFCGSLSSQARQIGNAVPVLLAEVFGRHILSHMELFCG